MSRLRELCERAGVTEKEWQALSLWNPGIVGYERIADALGLSRSTVVARIKSAKRKIAACEEIAL